MQKTWNLLDLHFALLYLRRELFGRPRWEHVACILWQQQYQPKEKYLNYYVLIMHMCLQREPSNFTEFVLTREQAGEDLQVSKTEWRKNDASNICELCSGRALCIALHVA